MAYLTGFTLELRADPCMTKGPDLPDELLRLSSPAKTLIILCVGRELTGFASHSRGASLVMNFGAH